MNKLDLEKILKIFELFSENKINNDSCETHKMVGKRCIVRTYSAGVHIGNIEYAHGTEALLKNSLRLWEWDDGGLSLSAIANNGVKKGRLNKTGEVYLTECIEFIPTTQHAEQTFKKFIEDDEND